MEAAQNIQWEWERAGWTFICPEFPSYYECFKMHEIIHDYGYKEIPDEFKVT